MPGLKWLIPPDPICKKQNSSFLCVTSCPLCQSSSQESTVEETYSHGFSISVLSWVLSCLTLVTPWTEACQAPLSMGFPRQAYWSGLSLPSPGDLPDPGIKPRSLCLLHWRWFLHPGTAAVFNVSSHMFSTGGFELVGLCRMWYSGL